MTDTKSCAPCTPTPTQQRNLSPKNATPDATSAQQHGLKALALLVLERNPSRNKCATKENSTRNKRAILPYKVPQQTQQVACASCTRFIPDPFGMYGIGSCDFVNSPRPLQYPKAKRRCTGFREAE